MPTTRSRGAVGVVAAAVELDGDVDDAAGVGDEVGRPEDPALARAGRRRASSASWLLAAPATIGTCSAGTVSWSSTPPSAHGARTSALGVERLGRRDPARAELRRPAASWSGRCRRRRASRRPWRSSFASARADVAQAADDDRAALRVGRAELALAATRGSPRRRRAPSTGSGRPSRRGGARGPVTCLVRSAIVSMSLRRGADVLGGDVPAAELLDGVAEVAQRRLAALRASTGPGEHDHALAAAQRQAGDGGLVGHRAREPQRVAHRGAGVVVAPHAAAAQRRAARGGVHGDDA